MDNPSFAQDEDLLLLNALNDQSDLDNSDVDFQNSQKPHVDPVKLACISTFKLNLE
ncbi:hypothetical protein HK096_000498, partial [Nowakowskiella sp. JEL0078]